MFSGIAQTSTLRVNATTPPTLVSNAFLKKNHHPRVSVRSATVDPDNQPQSWSSFSNLIAADAPTVKLASSNSTACDNETLSPVASINYITGVNTDSTWQSGGERRSV